MVSLGLDGGYRWVRDLGLQQSSLPVVQSSVSGEATAVWILTEGPESLVLHQLDPSTGSTVATTGVDGCAEDTRGVIYLLKQEEPLGAAIWCSSANW